MILYLTFGSWFGGLCGIGAELGIFYELFKMFVDAPYASTPIPKVVLTLELLIFVTGVYLYVVLHDTKLKYLEEDADDDEYE